MSEDKPATLAEKMDEMLEGKAKNETTQNEYEKLKSANDKMEAELKRGEELRAKQMLGGKALLSAPEKTKEQLAEERAAEIRKAYGR